MATDRREEIKQRLIATFQAELGEHLGTLNKSLLALEEGPSQEKRELLLAVLFRAAHSLKGAARVVELRDIETIAHRLEDVLGAIQRGDLSPTRELFNHLFPAVDALREAMAAHLRGESLPVEQRELLLAGLEAVLQGGASSPYVPPEPKQESVASISVSSPGLDEVTPRSPAAPLQGASAFGETIRVGTAKLDALMAGVGELLVARMRAEQHLSDLQTLWQQLALWEHSWRQIQTSYNHLQQQNGQRSDVAPLLDFLGRNEEYLKALSAGMNRMLHSFASQSRRLTMLTDDLRDGVHQMRMLPIATLFDFFPRMVRDLARERGKEVTLQVEGADTEVDRQVLEAMKDPLTHLLRNAVDHGIDPPDRRRAAGKPQRGTIHLRASQKGSTIVLEVADDGVGIDLEAVRRAVVERGLLTAQEVAGLSQRETLELIFRSGLSTSDQVTDLSGRGVGLDVVRENLDQLHGLIEVDTACGQGTTFTLSLPLTMATGHVLLVKVAGETVAVSTTTVERILRVDAADVGCIENKPAMRVNGQLLPLVSLAQVLELPRAKARLAPDQKMPVIVLGMAKKRVAFWVDGLQGTQEAVIKRLGCQLSRVRNVAGATILGSGQVVMILNVADLLKSAHAGRAVTAPLPMQARDVARRRLLVVDDSISTRTLEKNILESSGYQVLVAADGQEAWALVQSEHVDAVVADINMPLMDGFDLTEKIKSAERFRELPVILVSSLESPQDKIHGLEVGADAYITKGTFDQGQLLETIGRLIG